MKVSAFGVGRDFTWTQCSRFTEGKEINLLALARILLCRTSSSWCLALPVKSCIKAAAWVQLSDFSAGLYSRQAYVQVLHCGGHHKITYRTQICTQHPAHHTHFLCRVYSCGLYSRAAYVQDSQPKRETFMHDFTVRILGPSVIIRVYHRMKVLVFLWPTHPPTHSIPKTKEKILKPCICTGWLRVWIQKLFKMKTGLPHPPANENF